MIKSKIVFLLIQDRLCPNYGKIHRTPKDPKDFCFILVTKKLVASDVRNKLAIVEDSVSTLKKSQ